MNIRCENISFSYGNFPVLKGISLEAEKGELLSILGKNACGKSTLFKCMLGLMKNYGGNVFIGEKNIRDMTVGEISSHVAYIPQSTNPSFNFSVQDIVLMGTTAGASLFRTPKKEDVERADAALEKIGIEDLRMRCFHHLSGGERQLVVLARALAQNAGILMLDEPTSALDFGNQMLVLNCIRSLADEGYTVVQTTHNPEQSYMFSDKIAAIKDGTVLKCGSPKDVMDEQTVSALYGIDVEISGLYNDKVRVCMPKGL